MALSQQQINEINGKFEYLERAKEVAELEAARMRSQMAQMSTSPPDENSELAKLQLDCDKQLDQIYHNLSGHILVKTPNGGDYWQEPTDENLKILSQSGVYLIMGELRSHVNPITLLSNYTLERVEEIVGDFGRRMNRLIFNKAEFCYYYKTPEQLYEKYLPVVEKMKVDITKEELYEQCVKESREELKSKFTHHEAIVFAITELVYSTYLRAVGGEERKRLREKQVFHTSQTLQPTQPVKAGFFR